MLHDSSSDPIAARALATQLHGIAGELTAGMNRIEHRLDQLDFRGPAALRLRAAMVERRLRARRIAQELDDAADLVHHSSHLR